MDYVEPWWAPNCPPDDPQALPAPHVDKYWRGLYVDSPLKDEWLERMNSIPGMTVVYTDAGHGEGEILYPSIAFDMDPSTPLARSVPQATEVHWRDRWDIYNEVRARLQDRLLDLAEVDPEPTLDPQRLIAFRLVSWLPRIWMTECQYDAWWEQILAVLEDLAFEGWIV